MNEVINQLKSHVSVREFDPNYQLPQEALSEIIAASKQAPSWGNGQAYTILIFEGEDKESLLNILATSDSNQTNFKIIQAASVFLLFCIDFNHYLLGEQAIDFENEIEPLLIGTTDAALALQNAVIATQSLGLNSCVIGGIRRESEEIIAQYHLPAHVFPIAGVAIGNALTKKEPKPRLSDAVNVFKASEYKLPSEGDIKEYITELSEYSQRYGYHSENWLHRFQNFYGKKHFFDSTVKILKKQKLI